MKICKVVVGLWLGMIATSFAALVVQIDQPKSTGSKVIVKLELQNTYAEKIKAVRAVMFLMNDDGKVVGQSTSWIIGGGKDKPALDANAKTTYNFVITTDKPFTKSKLLVERILLENGNLADARKDVQITEESEPATQK